MGPDQKALIMSLMLVFDICNKYTVKELLITVLQKKTETLIYCVRVFEVNRVIVVQITIRCVTDNLLEAEPCSGDGVNSRDL